MKKKEEEGERDPRKGGEGVLLSPRLMTEVISVARRYKEREREREREREKA